MLVPFAISLVTAARSGATWREPYRLLYLCGMVFYITYGPLSKTLLEGELFCDENVVAGEQERTEYLNIAYRKNMDLQRLIHNLFEVTRMEGGTAAVESAPGKGAASPSHWKRDRLFFSCKFPVKVL